MVLTGMNRKSKNHVTGDLSKVFFSWWNLLGVKFKINLDRYLPEVVSAHKSLISTKHKISLDLQHEFIPESFAVKNLQVT